MKEAASMIILIVKNVENARKARDILRALCEYIVTDSQEPLDLWLTLLSFELEATVNKLAEWQDLWSPADLKSDASFSLLWGEAGQREIQTLLEKMDKPAAAICEQTTTLKVAVESRDKTAEEGKSAKSWFRWLFSLPGAYRSRTSARDRLNESIGDLTTTVTNLIAATDTHFRSMHALPPGEDHQSIDHRLTNALRSRSTSSAIYERCQRSGKDLELDLDLLNSGGDFDKFPDIFDWRDLNLTYHLIIHNTDEDGSTQHIRFESLLQPDQFEEGSSVDQDNVAHDTFSLSIDVPDGTFQQQLSHTVDGVGIYLTGDKYTVHTPVGSAEQSQTLLSVEELLSKTQDSDMSPLSFAQRVHLAYRIVEAAMFLIGTPFLSYLSHSTIVTDVHIRGDDDLRYCGLRLNFAAGLQGEILSQSEMLERLQIYRVGVVLLEIGLQRTFNGDIVGQPDLLLPDGDKQLEKATNSIYATACERCFSLAGNLQSKHTDEACWPESSNAVLTTFYTEVFLRLRGCMFDLL